MAKQRICIHLKEGTDIPSRNACGSVESKTVTVTCTSHEAVLRLMSDPQVNNKGYCPMCLAGLEMVLNKIDRNWRYIKVPTLREQVKQQGLRF